MFVEMEERPVEVSDDRFSGSGIFLGVDSTESETFAVVEMDDAVRMLLINKIRFTDRKASEVEWEFV